MQMAKAPIIHSNHPSPCRLFLRAAVSQCTSGLVPVVRAQSGDVFPVLSVKARKILLSHDSGPAPPK